MDGEGGREMGGGLNIIQDDLLCPRDGEQVEAPSATTSYIHELHTTGAPQQNLVRDLSPKTEKAI
jgi:hypothetical protein